MLLIILEIMSNFFDCLLLHFIFSSQLTTKNTKIKNVSLFSILLCILTIIKKLPVSTAISVTLLFFCFVIYGKLYSTDSYDTCSFWSIVFITLVMFSDEMTYLIVNLVFPSHLSSLEHLGWFRTEGMLIYYIILIPGSLLASHWKKSTYQLSRPLSIMFYIAVAIGITFFYIQIDMTVLLSQDSAIDSGLRQISLIASLLMIFFFIIMIFIITSINHLYSKYQQIKILQLESNNADKLFQSYEQTASLVRLWRHDYQNHIRSIKALSQSKKWNELTNYLSELDNDTIGHMSIPSTGNIAIDMILSAKIASAEENHIVLNWSIYMPDSSPLSPVELTSLIGNVLDNALDACKTLPTDIQRNIQLSIKPWHGSLLIWASNPSSGIYQKDPKGQLLSTKKESGHGIGLQQIKRIVEHHQGFIDIQAGRAQFDVRIMIPFVQSLTSE